MVTKVGVQIHTYSCHDQKVMNRIDLMVYPGDFPQDGNQLNLCVLLNLIGDNLSFVTNGPYEAKGYQPHS